MNLLLFEPNEINNKNIVSLHDRRSEHIIKVLGCRPGDTVRAGVINGSIGTGEILEIRGKGKQAEVTLRFTSYNFQPEQPSVDLILGLVRPIMLKRLLTQVTSLGVGRIFLINANRVEKSFFNAGLFKNENYRHYLVLGLEQAKDTRLPQVGIYKGFRSFTEDFLPGITADYNRMLIAHPEGGMNLKQIGDGELKGRTLLAVGPEGGWIDFEIEKFLSHSFQPVNLGSRILRTDTAVIALLAQIMLLQE